MVLLPPDQSLRIQTLNQRLVILSVGERGIEIGASTSYDNFSTSSFKNGAFFFTESLLVTSDIVAPFGLTISTWDMVCSRTGVLLSATGVDGQEDGNSETRIGQPGSFLKVYIQDLDDATCSLLTLQSRGGAGGNAKLSPGVVGNGGRGGYIATVFQPTYVRILAKTEEYFTRSEFHPDVLSKYHEHVEPNSSLLLEAKRVLSIGGEASATDEVIGKIFGRLSQEVEKIDNNEIRTVLDVKFGVSDTIQTLESLIANQKFLLTPQTENVRGGYPGVGIDVMVAEAGRQGDSGNQVVVFVETSTLNKIEEARLPLVHPVQCAMLLTRANTFFYINSPRLRSAAARLYGRLIERTKFLTILNEKSETLWSEAYKKCDIMPLTSIGDLQQIATEATNNLVRLNSGLVNYHGFTSRWVPRASYTFYKQFLNNALDDLTEFERAYIEYNTALSSQQTVNDKAKLAYDKTSRMVASLDADISDLKSKLRNLDMRITAKTSVVESAHTYLIRAYNAEHNAIEAAFGLSVPQIINALTLIAFSPTKFIFLVQAGDLVYQGFTSIPGRDGSTVRQEYLASEFKQSQATIKDISVELQSKINGEYQLDEAFAKRLIVVRDQLLSQLNEFSHKAFGGVHDEDAKKDLEEKFNVFVKSVTDRNNLIFDYNTTYKLILSKGEEKAEFQRQQTELVDRQIQNDDADLPEITAYIEKIYQASRARVMKLLDIILRSLNFRMLISSDIYDYAFPGTDPKSATDLDSVPLSLTSTVLREVRGNIESKFGEAVERWGSEPTRFPGNFNKDVGKRYILTQYQRKALLRDHTVVIQMKPIFKFTPNAGDFTGCCNVRLYRVRFGLTGLKLSASLSGNAKTDARVQFTLIHGGQETLVDRSNAGFNFDHDEIPVLYSFRLKSGKGGECMTVLDNGNIGESDINQPATSYAAPGPYTEWTVDMNGTEFEKLDMTGVTDAYFDFCGTNYAYA